ncbi:hypothetical protein H1Z61_15540 [Bacillus aquiflavi]|uniref:Uncharacterized protein n=1 Tax=Bacillus aquiflavi TaxID=2672567 RepID=A0A6B3W304_9BACI|nr:hypothetical protein [Bacillus aquiflavi]MBA4538504.1 hypothetical protein [Bacillus aquiflavi]NEY82867.1 hypothetical protein [Bacillus aquiflavi]UAC48115.1 hypothetical protein K6959_16290 [Bacillus aquiflavi]
MTQNGQLPISHDSVSKMMTSEAYRKLLGSLVQKVGLEPINTVEREAYGNDNSIKYHVYADGLIVMEADRSGKVHYEVVPAIPEEIRDGVITSPVDRAFEGVIDGMGKALGDTIDGLVSLYKFAEKNLQPGDINYIEKAIFAYQLIHDPKKRLEEMKDKVINFPKYMWEGMKNAWNRDVINGDAHSRAEFFSYGLTTIGIGVIGDKGLSRAGQLGNAAKLGHVGKVGNVANKIPPPIPINKGLTPAFVTGTANPIPYNVMDDLYNRIHQASKEAFGDSRGGKVSIEVGGTSKKASEVNKFKFEEITAPSSGKKIKVYTNGETIIPVDKIEKYMRGKVNGDLETIKRELFDLKQFKQNQRKVFDKNPENQKRIKKLENMKHNVQRSQDMSEKLTSIGLNDTTVNNKMIMDNIMEVGKKVTANNRVDVPSVLEGPNGKLKVLTTWSLVDGKPYLSTIKLIPIK